MLITHFALYAADRIGYALRMTTAAIIVASGESRRMGFDKLTAPLLGVPVLRRTVEAFCTCPDIDIVVVVCPEERFDAVLLGSFRVPVIRVDGGNLRQDSVRAGLKALPAEITLVAVHDGARPLIDSSSISRCLSSAAEHGAAALARRVTETIKRADSAGFARNSVDRQNLWYMETPQCFRLNVLRRAYRHVIERGLVVTDEVSALESIGVSTFLLESTRPNVKITVPLDLEFAAHWIDA